MLETCQAINLKQVIFLPKKGYIMKATTSSMFMAKHALSVQSQFIRTNDLIGWLLEGKGLYNFNVM